MNLNDWEITLNGQTVVYSDYIDDLFPDTRSKNQNKKEIVIYVMRSKTVLIANIYIKNRRKVNK